MRLEHSRLEARYLAPARGVGVAQALRSQRTACAIDGIGLVALELVAALAVGVAVAAQRLLLPSWWLSCRRTAARSPKGDALCDERAAGKPITLFRPEDFSDAGLALRVQWFAAVFVLGLMQRDDLGRGLVQTS